MKKDIGPYLGIYPSPVAVVGTYDGNDKPNIATLAWVGVCCSEPPSVQISLRKSRHTYDAIVSRKAFSVNIPSAKYIVETDYAGCVSGRDFDKFAAAKLTPVRGKTLYVPLVEEFPVSMECRMTATLELGSHVMFVGEIVSCLVDENAFEENGKPDVKKIDPLTFMPGGAYFGVAGFLGTSHKLGQQLIKK